MHDAWCLFVCGKGNGRNEHSAFGVRRFPVTGLAWYKAEENAQVTFVLNKVSLTANSAMLVNCRVTLDRWTMTQ